MIQGHLRRFPRFDELSDGDVRVLERTLSAQRLRKGQVLIREGDRAAGSNAAMFLVLEGGLALERRTPVGGFSVDRTLGPGELVGVIALVRDVARAATVRALGPATVAGLTRAQLGSLRREQPEAWAWLQHVVAKQLAADFRAMHNRLRSQR